MSQILCVPDVNKIKSLNPILYFIESFPKLLSNFITELINLKYAVNIPFKVTLRTIIMVTSFPVHDGVQIHFLNTVSSEILLQTDTFKQ